jgi:hypothetical protein
MGKQSKRNRQPGNAPPFNVQAIVRARELGYLLAPRASAAEKRQWLTVCREEDRPFVMVAADLVTVQGRTAGIVAVAWEVSHLDADIGERAMTHARKVVALDRTADTRRSAAGRVCPGTHG